MEGKELIVRGSGTMFFDIAKFEHAQRVANLLTSSSMVPVQFQGKANLGNCVIALNLAERMGVDPFMLMQNMYIVHGRPGIEAKLAIALVNGSGKFTPLQFKLEGEGKTRQCTCYATHKETKEVCSQTVTWKMVEAEGWDKPKGTQVSKWVTMPDLMFQYRAAMFFTRIYCPEVIMGFRSVEEIIDMTPMENGKTYEMPVPELTPEDMEIRITAFDDSIPKDINQDLLTTFLDKSREVFEKEIDEIKVEACEDLQVFWKQYRIWEKNQRPKKEKKEKAKEKQEVIEPEIVEEKRVPESTEQKSVKLNCPVTAMKVPEAQCASCVSRENDAGEIICISYETYTDNLKGNR